MLTREISPHFATFIKVMVTQLIPLFFLRKQIDMLVIRGMLAKFAANAKDSSRGRKSEEKGQYGSEANPPQVVSVIHGRVG